MKEESGKRRIRHRGRFLALLVCVACVLAVGVTVAYMFRKSKTVDETMVPASIDCSVEENYNESLGLKSNIRVKNEGDVPVYVRLKLVSYWQDGNGNIVGKPSELTVVVNENAGWKTEGNGNDKFYYYTKPVSAGEDTPSLLKSAIQLGTGYWQDVNGNSITVYQMVEVFAEAIQSEPASAVTEAWGVTMDSGE